MPIRSKFVSSVIKSRIVPSKRIVADTVTTNKIESLSLANITDIDLTGLTDGSFLIYDESIQKFKVTNVIDNTNLTLTGGTFD